MPEFVDNISSRATDSSIKISWSAPNVTSGQNLCVDQYYVDYRFGLEYSMRETMQTELNLSELPPLTYIVFSIRAEYRGRLGPVVYIGQSTGKVIVIRIEKLHNVRMALLFVQCNIRTELKLILDLSGNDVVPTNISPHASNCIFCYEESSQRLCFGRVFRI